MSQRCSSVIVVVVADFGQIRPFFVPLRCLRVIAVPLSNLRVLWPPFLYQLVQYGPLHGVSSESGIKTASEDACGSGSLSCCPCAACHHLNHLLLPLNHTLMPDASLSARSALKSRSLATAHGAVAASTCQLLGFRSPH